MTSTTSRRAVLAGVAAVPALSLPAIAAAPDPVFAAIGHARAAVEAHLVAIHAEPEDWDTPEHSAWDETAAETCHAAMDARFDLFETVPTTAAGAIAMIAFVIEWGDSWRDWAALAECKRRRDDTTISGGVIKPMLESLSAFLAVQS